MSDNTACVLITGMALLFFAFLILAVSDDGDSE